MISKPRQCYYCHNVAGYIQNGVPVCEEHETKRDLEDNGPPTQKTVDTKQEEEDEDKERMQKLADAFSKYWTKPSIPGFDMVLRLSDDK